MITVDINAFRKNLKKYLIIPCQVTRYGVAVASIVPTGISKLTEELLDLHEETLLKKTNVDPVPLGMKKVETTYVDTTPVHFHEKMVAGTKFRVCPHENESGQCPMGCKEVK